ncbi:anthranilate phosphoribosyltransferase [Evansella sp. AB-P1]|uniref:anthranilate phosphoribosyltransferase n=1 Tax=Evansella sp. AB-P1 TaxID=3037653 RepID=UPI00241F9317|nr:anthranilate phosphoribosyltransferase [Evansella sp. AB-P1]MDG5787592.1 anthranilate phosphoribosyltransferase [Evansella sp. AB-P1]
MNNVVEKLLNKATLDVNEAKALVLDMLMGEVTDEQIAAILTILRYRGETVDEIVGFAKGMQETSIQITPPVPVLDTCGTGGDGIGTFNISTAVALLVSSLNVPVAKHGNRSVSSKTGSADVLETLNIPIQTNKEDALKFLQEHHLCFLFAPIYHSAMKHVGKARKQLGVKTIFNLLGPLTNPAGASKRLIGVYNHDQAIKMAEASVELGIKRAMFVTGADGLDELTITGTSFVVEVNDGVINKYTITPEDVGLRRGKIDALLVDSPNESAAMIESVFNLKGPAEAETILLYNAGAALYVYGRVSSIADGVQLAKGALGKTVLGHLENLKQINREEVSR